MTTVRQRIHHGRVRLMQRRQMRAFADVLDELDTTSHEAKTDLIALRDHGECLRER